MARDHVKKRKKGKLLMNREYLKGLGLEQEVIDGIMAEHGKAVQAAKPTEDFEALKSEKETLAQQLAELNNSLSSITDAKSLIEQEKETLAQEVNTFRQKDLKTRIAHEYKIPFELAGRLTGETEDELKADAQSLSQLIVQKPVMPLASTEPNETDPKEAAYKSVLQNLNFKGE